MGTFEIYLLKSVAAISILNLFYWLILRNENHYNLNRIFLLASILISILVPLVSLKLDGIPAGFNPSNLAPVIVNGYLTTTEPLRTHNNFSILSIIYISGAVFFSLRFLSGIARILFLYFRYPKYKFDGFKALVLDRDQSPFSFFNLLFISRNDFAIGKTNEMIVHEKAHKEDYHSIDILLMEGLTIIQWFNPFVWMLRKALISEHEFIADNKVLLEGFDKVKYQKLLFEKSLGVTSFNLTNSFNNSILKKRLKMMTISKTSKLIQVKYLLSIPLLLVTILLTAINFDANGQDEKIYTDVDVPAQYKNGNIEGILGFFQQSITYPKSARENNVAAKIFVQFVIDEKGKVVNVEILRSDILDIPGKVVVVKGYTSSANPEIDSKSVADLEAEAIRVTNLLTDLTPAQKEGKSVKTQFTIPILFSLENKNN